MPEMDGYEATRLIRIAERECEMDINPCARRKCFDGITRSVCGAGMDDYISKPIDPSNWLCC